MPDTLQDRPDESSRISVHRIVSMIGAVATVADDLDHALKLKMLHTLDALIADIPADDRGPIEAAISAILKTGADTEKFMGGIPKPTAGPVFTPYSFDDLLAMPPKEWIIDQIMGVGDMGIIYGAPGCGKTFVGIDMTVAACTGSMWAMRFAVVRPLNVAYCAGEGISGLPDRFKAAAHHHGVSTLPNFTFFKTVPQLFSGKDEATIATIYKFVAEWKARQSEEKAQPLYLMFVDTLHTATVAADENSAQDMGKVLHACRWASSELGCAVVLIHHTTKNGATERGSSALRGAADFMIEVRRISDIGTKSVMHCSKLKDGEAWKDQTLDLVSIDDFASVRVWWDEPADSSELSGKQSGDVEAIVSLLSSSETGSRHRARSIAESIGLNPASTQIFKLIKMAMAEDSAIKSGLKFPGKDAHSKNPTMYWYSPPD